MLARNLKTVIGYRNTELKIDLGKEFLGVIAAKMKRNPDGIDFREFEIVDNRYLVLSEEQTKDIEETENVQASSILGRWYFDVKQVLDEVPTVIYTGTIFFKGNIT